jgi:uncharacterized protein (UPF0212 family)
MRTPSHLDLLEWWDLVQTQPIHRRGLALLAAAYPETSRDTLARLPIGERDALLLTLREATFGGAIAALTDCPHCGEHLELDFKTSDVRMESGTGLRDEETVDAEGYQIRLRLPNSLDLAALVPGEDLGLARSSVVHRCIGAVNRQGELVPAADLSAIVIQAAVERLAQADPQADVLLAVDCPQCQHHWEALFDIVSFFWAELNARAQYVLREVHELARAYGWGEADILAMSPGRKQFYLDLVAG